MIHLAHAGQETGNALADVLFGDVNPAGRLTQTWYKSEAELPGILEYDIIKADRTYLYDRSTPLYPFGHGLSYTTFRYGDLRLSAPVLASGGTVTVSVDVTNTGQRAGDEVVQLYTHQRTSRDKQPVKALRGVQRVHLSPGETKTVRIPLRATDLVHWDVTRDKWVLESSIHDMMVGGSSADIRQGTTLRVVGEKIPPRDLSKETRAANFGDYAGIELVDETKVCGDAIGRIDAGDWIKFADANLGRGVSSFTARVSRVDAGNATIQIRLDDPVTGPVIGTAQVTSTGDIYRYETTTAVDPHGQTPAEYLRDHAGSPRRARLRGDPVLPADRSQTGPQRPRRAHHPLRGLPLTALNQLTSHQIPTEVVRRDSTPPR